MRSPTLKFFKLYSNNFFTKRHIWEICEASVLANTYNIAFPVYKKLIIHAAPVAQDYLSRHTFCKKLLQSKPKPVELSWDDRAKNVTNFEFYFKGPASCVQPPVKSFGSEELDLISQYLDCINAGKKK